MAVGGQVSEFPTEENQLHKRFGIWVHCALDSSKRGGSQGCLVLIEYSVL